MAYSNNIDILRCTWYYNNSDFQRLLNYTWNIIIGKRHLTDNLSLFI